MNSQLKIAEPLVMEEAWGTELYAIAYNDGFDHAWKGHQIDKPFWWARAEAARLGHRWPRDYAKAFNDGYREGEAQRDDYTIG